MPQSFFTKSTLHTVKTYALIIIATFGLVAIVDVCIRTYEVISGALFVQRNSSLIMKNISIKKYRSESTANPFLLYTSVPNYKGLLPLIEPGKEFRVSINSHGFRTKDFYPKLPWKTRVVIMGDSFMWGYNANQDETAAASLEKLIHQNLSKDVEVYSLGVSSYSGVRYAALARIYLDFLSPDIVIVALDQSDFGEDRSRIKDYLLDDDGYPLVLKDAEEILQKKEGAMLALDVWGNMVKESMTFDLRTRIRMGSPLGEFAFGIADFLRQRETPDTISAGEYINNKSSQSIDQALENGSDSQNTQITKLNFSQHYPGIKIVTYDQLVEKFGDDISPGLPQYLVRDTIPYLLDRAFAEYQPTYKSMEYISNETSKRGQAFFLASYPYPKMITPFENIEYNIVSNKSDTVYDFSHDRIHPQLMDRFADKLNITHINTYPLFEKQSDGMWGKFDPHFSAKGYALFARGLFDGIKDELNQRIAEKKKMAPE